MSFLKSLKIWDRICSMTAHRTTWLRFLRKPRICVYDLQDKNEAWFFRVICHTNECKALFRYQRGVPLWIHRCYYDKTEHVIPQFYISHFPWDILLLHHQLFFQEKPFLLPWTDDRQRLSCIPCVNQAYPHRNQVKAALTRLSGWERTSSGLQ